MSYTKGEFSGAGDGATIPTYNQANPNLWTPTGQQTVQLALVGMHVVGSTAEHPEMVWATREEQCWVHGCVSRPASTP